MNTHGRLKRKLPKLSRRPIRLPSARLPSAMERLQHQSTKPLVDFLTTFQSMLNATRTALSTNAWMSINSKSDQHLTKQVIASRASADVNSLEKRI